ncbi:MAG: hypothetical protein K2X27_25770 [Candidatus Obscuribacterales bacterium]|nr:hypothetical protein [Candidatus Obscuribacterales bacterium]
MSIWSFLGVALFAYLCGLLGSLLGAKKVTSDNRQPGGWEIFIFVLLVQVFIFWPVQIVKITLALTLSYLLAGSDYAMLGSGAVCFVAGFLTMRFLPQILKALKKVAAFFRRLLKR